MKGEEILVGGSGDIVPTEAGEKRNMGLPDTFYKPNWYRHTFKWILGEISFILFTTVLFLLFAQLYIKFKRYLGTRNKHRSKEIGGFEVIPGPPRFPIDICNIIGNVHLMWPLSNVLRTHEKWRDEFGEIYRLYGCTQFGIVANAPELIQTILKSGDLHHLTKSKLAYEIMAPFITNGLLVSKGKFWQAERRVLMRSTSFQQLRAYIPMLNTHSQRFVDKFEKLFQDGKVHTISEIINSSFLEVICEMITGFDIYNTPEGLEYHHNFEIWKTSVAYRMIKPWFSLNILWKLNPFSWTADRAVKHLRNFARNKLEQHRSRLNKIEQRTKMEAINNNNTLNDGNFKEDEQLDLPPFRCVLDELLDAGVSDDQIVDEMNTMLFGGHDTGASAIHFFCFLMALNPDAQELCRKEVGDVFEDPMLVQEGKMTFDSVASLKYLERCLLETLRLYPSVVVFLRGLEAPLMIEYRGKPVELPVGTTATLFPYTLHRNPKYFPDPLRFDPNRFLPEECAKRNTYSFIPFSAGPRNCLGIKFAMIEMKIMAAYLLRNFEIYTTDKVEDITILPNLTLMPHRDMNFIFKKRSITISK